jgi:glycosyltransferase involved in cell wall biosynthesis
VDTIITKPFRTFILVEKENQTETFLARDIQDYYPHEVKVISISKVPSQVPAARFSTLKIQLKSVIPRIIIRWIKKWKQRCIGRRLVILEGLTRDDVLVSYWCNHVLAIAEIIREETLCTLEVCCHSRDIYVNSYLGEISNRNIRAFYFCCQKSMEWSLRTYHLDPIKVFYRPHQSTTKSQHRGHSTCEFRMLNVARNVPKKNLPAVFAFVERLKDNIPDLKFIQIGDTAPRMNSLDNKGVDSQFLGLVPAQEVAEAMATSDCFIYGSIIAKDGDRDGVPNALLEAKAMGLPVITEAGWANRGLLPEGLNLTVDSLDTDFDQILAWLRIRFPEKFLLSS